MKGVNVFISCLEKLNLIIKFYYNKFGDGEYLDNANLESILGSANYNKLISSDMSNIYVEIHHILVDIVNRESDNLNIYSAEQSKNIKFVICSVMDEIIIKHISHSDVKEWDNLLLERYFFNSSIAGEKLIEMIEDHNRSHINNNNFFSIIYYYTLCLGFEGVYKNQPEKIKLIKENSYKILQKDFNINFSEIQRNIDLQSYENIKGPEYSRVINYKSIYFYTVVIYVLLQCLFVFYLIFNYFKNKFSC